MKTLSKILLVFVVLLLLSALALYGYQLYQNRDNDIVSFDEENQEIQTEDLNTSTWQDIADENYVIDSEGFSEEFSQNNDLTENEADLVETARLEQISKNFIEVYGSYSTDSSYQNLKDLKHLLTESYWADLESYILNADVEDAYSVWTTALKAQLIKKGRTEASVKVKTKRGERESRIEIEKIFYQEAEVYLLKEGGIWLISKVKWID
jgi:hypothetical protein